MNKKKFFICLFFVLSYTNKMFLLFFGQVKSISLCWPITNPFWWLAFRSLRSYDNVCSSLRQFIRCCFCCLKINHLDFLLFRYAFSSWVFSGFSFWNWISVLVYFVLFLFFSTSSSKKSGKKATPTHNMDDITLFIVEYVVWYFLDDSRLQTCFIIHCFPKKIQSRFLAACEILSTKVIKMGFFIIWVWFF